MPRKARVLVPNCPHHIVQRGHNRKAVFVTDDDYNYYLSNLKEWKEELGIKLYGWCLMTNHIHLIVDPGDEPRSLSLLMKRVNGRQTAYVNKVEGRSGSLWEGRYKASPIQMDNYLLSCCRYVELNPVRAGMVEKAEDYPWSSYQERMQGSSYKLLDNAPAYMGLAESTRHRRARYEAFVRQGVPVKESQFLVDLVMRNQLTGNQRFVDEVEQRIGIRVEQRGRGRPRKDEK
jgi:putative transposase